MKYYSTNRSCPAVSAGTAILEGLAPDGGLYMPAEIPRLPKAVLEALHTLENQELAYAACEPFLSEEIPSSALRSIVADTLGFEAPLVAIDDDTAVLELFHGPTLAFKDFGARFMARTIAYLRREEKKELCILAATSGDTGSAVAHGFYKIPGVQVILLYPSGKVSRLQEQQLTTLGENIIALEIDGTFDDCQRLVKEAFADADLRRSAAMSSANSINIARLIPQTFYYFFAISRLAALGNGRIRPTVFSVPSGNFGNLTAGVIAKRLGLPIERFVAATNRNSIVPEYLETGTFTPRPSIKTLSNAMDVGNPSNFARLLDLFSGSASSMKEELFGTWFSDEQTAAAIVEQYRRTGYLFDPHGAVGMLGLEAYRAAAPGSFGIVLETAHPAKFIETMEDLLPGAVTLPPPLVEAMNKPKVSVKLPPSFDAFKELLRSRR